nr:zinc finger protein 57 [Hymenolepis microstoma]
MLGYSSSKIGSKIRWVDPSSLGDIKPDLETSGAQLQDVAKGYNGNEVGYGSEVEHILRPDIDGYVAPSNGQAEIKKEDESPILKSALQHCQTLPRRLRGRPKKQKRAVYLHDRSEKVEAWVPSDDESDFNPHETDYHFKKSKRGDSLKCFICKKAFIPTTLKFHVQKCHKDFPKNQCFICGKTFCSAQVAQKHMQSSHFCVHNYVCPNCGRGYYYYMKLHSHMRRVHNYELPPSRRQCQVRGGNRQPILRSPSIDLHEHQEVHEQGLELRDADCRCPVCRQIFLIDFLSGHMKDSHKQFPPEQCYFCDTSFPNSELTQQHIQFSHLKPALYTCHECSKMFADLPEFRDHMLQIHQSDTTYKCDHCERVFVWKKYLRQHIRQEHPSDGTVFSMRNNFHSERTSLTTVCDKQQQGLLAEIAVKPEEPKQQQKEQEELKDPSIVLKQESSTSNGESDYGSVQL